MKFRPDSRPYLMYRTESLANIGPDYSQQNTIIPTGSDVPFYGWVESISTTTQDEQELTQCTIATRRTVATPSVRDWLIKLPASLPQGNDSRYYMRVDGVEIRGDYFILSCQSSSVPTANDPLNLSISTMAGLTNLYEPCFNLSDNGRMITDSKGGQHLYGGGNATSSAYDGTRSGLGIVLASTKWMKTLAALAVQPTHTVYAILRNDSTANTLHFILHIGTVNGTCVRLYNNVTPAGLQHSAGLVAVDGRLPPYAGFFAHSATSTNITLYPSGISASGTGQSVATADPFELNGRSDGGFCTNLTFYACGIFNRALSAGELTKIKAYYTRRGIPT